MAKGKLTAKQQKFVEEYMVDLNATQACIRAGYSARTADRIGPELLGKTWVAAEIAKRQREQSEKMNITREDIIRGLQEIATGKKTPAAARTSAWTTIAKMLGHMVERRKVESEGKLTIKIVDYSKAHEDDPDPA